jgi:predicted RNA-binding Zn-ribbon protein involved in translation (DUF1610 family)
MSSLFGARKRAALTRTAFDFIRVEVPCPQCGEKGLQPLAELEVNMDAVCPYCGTVIDLSSQRARAEIGQHSEEYKQIKRI